MQPELVSIMMPAYNAEQYIGQAIESVLAQSHSHWELIVVNDGSTDGTAAAAAQFADPRIKVIHQPNGGEAAARNTALQAMRGEFVAFLDADDVYLPNHLELAVGYLQNHLDHAGVYTDGYYCDPAGSRLQTLASRRIGPFEGRVFEEVVRASCIFGPPVCVVLRRDPIDRYHLTFDTDITIGPDWDFFIRYTDVAQFGHLHQHTCLYRVHQTNISNRIGLQQRALDLTKCRLKAIKMPSFTTCSIETRTAVFYDVLVNLLRNHPERQSEIAQWPEFRVLPRPEQARLLRLMASKAVIDDGCHRYIGEWLRRSRELNPADGRGALLAMLYGASPRLCSWLLRMKTRGQSDSLNTPPFADLQMNST